MRGKPGIIALESAGKTGERVNEVLCEWYGQDDYLIPSECPRFGSGEGKGIIRESVRERDIFILVDVCNNSLTYKMDGAPNRMSPDDHYQDLKRVIAACNGKASRITVIMPFLYESRQHRKTMRESLDCAMMLRELDAMGVHDVITFERVVFMATLFGVNIGMFYKRRDYGVIVNGINPIIAHDFCGESVEGKDIVVIDDMISSGGSMIDVAGQLKARGARRIFVFATFGLFTHGFEKFDKAYADGIFDKIFTTNLIYQKPELFEKEYYSSVGMNRYIAAIIDTLNKGNSLQEIIKPEKRIRETVDKYKK